MTETVASALSLSAELENSSSARLDAEILLAEVLSTGREQLLADPSQPLHEPAFALYRDFIRRRKQGEPVAYLVGRKGFWDFELGVNNSVLIPRPETELLVEQAQILFAERKQEELAMADLGTGSGALAIALARMSPNWRIIAVDISADALEVARKNADSLGAGNIEFIEGSWCEGLPDGSYHLIVANPPYVAPGDSHLQQDSLPFEPTIALVSPRQGLADIEKIARQSCRCLKQDGVLLIEHGFDQRDAVEKILEQCGYSGLQSFKDMAGINRAMLARYPGDTQTS